MEIKNLANFLDIDSETLKKAESDLQSITLKVKNLNIEDLFSFTQDYVDFEVANSEEYPYFIKPT